MHYITEKSYIRPVNKSLIKFNKIINRSYANMKKSSAKVNLTDDFVWVILIVVFGTALVFLYGVAAVNYEILPCDI